MQFSGASWMALTVLITSILISYSAASILLQWVALEIGALVFILILSTQSSKKGSMSAVMYFASQTPVSVFMLVSFFFLSGYWVLNVLLFGSIMFKLGIPPFHSWSFCILMELNYFTLMMMLSFQKISPMIILSNFCYTELFKLSAFLMILILINASNMVTSFASLVLLSSMSNSYMLVFSLTSCNYWVEFIVCYTLFFMWVVFFMYKSSIWKTSDLVKLNLAGGATLIISMMIISGLPPFLGFLMKIMILKSILGMNMEIFLIVVLIMFSQWMYVNMVYLGVSAAPVYKPMSKTSASYQSSGSLFIIMMINSVLSLIMFKV